MTDVMIRRAHLSDAEALSQFAARLFRLTYGDDTSEADLEAHIRDKLNAERHKADIADPAGAIFIAEFNGEIAGYAHVTADTPAAFLDKLYIDVEWRGRGLSSRLLQAVIDEARLLGAARLELTVYERNGRAIGFYRKAGFVTTGSTIFTVGEDQQTDLVMALELAQPIAG